MKDSKDIAKYEALMKQGYHKHEINTVLVDPSSKQAKELLKMAKPDKGRGPKGIK